MWSMRKDEVPEGWDYWNKYRDPKVYDWCDPVMYGYLLMKDWSDDQPIDVDQLDEDVKKLYLAKDGDLEAVIPTLKDPELRESLLIKKNVKSKYTVYEQNLFRWFLYHYMYYLLEVYIPWFNVDAGDMINYLEIYYYPKNKLCGVNHPILSRNPSGFFVFNFMLADSMWGSVYRAIPFSYKNQKPALFFSFSVIERTLLLLPPSFPKFSRDVIAPLNDYFLREGKDPVIWLHRYKNVRGFAIDSNFWEAYLSKLREVWYFTRDFGWYAVSHSLLEVYIAFYNLRGAFYLWEDYIVHIITVVRVYSWNFLMDTPELMEFARAYYNIIQLLSFVTIYEEYVDADDNPFSFARYPELNRLVLNLDGDISWFRFSFTFLQNASAFLKTYFDHVEFLQISQIFDSIFEGTDIEFDLYLTIQPKFVSKKKKKSQILVPKVNFDRVSAVFCFTRQFIMFLDTFKHTNNLYNSVNFLLLMEPFFIQFVLDFVKRYGCEGCDEEWAISYFKLPRDFVRSDHDGHWRHLFNLFTVITFLYAIKVPYCPRDVHWFKFKPGFRYRYFFSFRHLQEGYIALNLPCSSSTLLEAIYYFNIHCGKVVNMDMFHYLEANLWGMWLASTQFSWFFSRATILWFKVKRQHLICKRNKKLEK